MTKRLPIRIITTWARGIPATRYTPDCGGAAGSAFWAPPDHHAGFPGSYGDGLTAVLAKEKSREAIWEALLSGRAYAVTGDRIECDFTVNGQGLGETVRGAKRKLRCAVKGEYWADKLVIYKNCRPLAVLCGEQLRPKPARAYKLRVEMGWGNSEELTRWAGRITTDGRLAGANLYLRGRSLLSPTNHDGSPVEVNEIDNRVLEQDTQAFAWQCETVRNKSTLHPQTDAVVAEIEGGPDTVVNVTVNGRTHTASIAQLLDGGVTWHVKPWHSEAVKIHAAVPDSAYEMVLEAGGRGQRGHGRVSCGICPEERAVGVCLAHIRRAVKQRPGADAKRKNRPLGTAHAIPGTEKQERG